jgi:hypothetical protein
MLEPYKCEVGDVMQHYTPLWKPAGEAKCRTISGKHKILSSLSNERMDFGSGTKERTMSKNLNIKQIKFFGRWIEENLVFSGRWNEEKYL